jgi:hypothetical protein
MFFVRHHSAEFTVGSSISLFQPSFLFSEIGKYYEIYMHRPSFEEWEHHHLGTFAKDSLCTLEGASGVRGTSYISVHSYGTRHPTRTTALQEVTKTIVRGAVPGMRANIRFKQNASQSVSYTGEIPLFPEMASCASIIPRTNIPENDYNQSAGVYLLSLKDRARQEKKLVFELNESGEKREIGFIETNTVTYLDLATSDKRRILYCEEGLVPVYIRLNGYKCTLEHSHPPQEYFYYLQRREMQKKFKLMLREHYKL